MADYDSDSSLSSSGDIRTQVLLGYASATPTSDDFSQIGGHPSWLDPHHPPPSATLAKCKICGKLMSLMVQLNADLPGEFEGHERRLYVWVCRGKGCRGKEGSVRGFRGVRITGGAASSVEKKKEEEEEEKKEEVEQPKRVGEALFGVKPVGGSGGNPFSGGGNPFSSGGNGTANANPFAGTASLAAKPAQKPTQQQQQQQPEEEPAAAAETKQSTLPETFAQKARISTSSSSSTTIPPPSTPSEPWPSPSSFPKPYPSSHIDAGAEYIDSTPDPAAAAPSNIRVDDSAEGAMGIKDAFESSMDKTFQKFADRLSQNPEQILRYEFSGQPLLYSKTDAVGKIFSSSAAAENNNKIAVRGIPRCGNCGAGRKFELQLTPQLIMELEREEMGLDGMDWGSVVLGCCERDCCPTAGADDGGGEGNGRVGFVEEWVGVQWEGKATHKRPT